MYQINLSSLAQVKKVKSGLNTAYRYGCKVTFWEVTAAAALDGFLVLVDNLKHGLLSKAIPLEQVGFLTLVKT